MEITIHKPEQVAVAFKSTELKAQAAQIAQQCNDIIIVDDSSLSIAQTMLVSANKTVGMIEKTRKSLKEPFLDMGKRIDTVAKELSEVMAEAVKLGKEKILAYNEEVEKKKLEEQAELERKAEIARQEALKETQRIEKITIWITTFEKRLIELINGASTIGELAEIYNTRIKTFPDDAFFAEFVDNAKEMLERVKGAGKARKIYLDKVAEANAEKADELARKELKRQEIVNRNIIEQASAMEEKKEEVAQQVQDVADMKTAEITGQSVALQNEKVSGITKRWNFEIIDLNKIPRSFLKVDEPGIRKWMTENKEILNDGEVINGIKYFIEKGVRLA